jgi:2-iminobutanoate/2-iminopropanoate deaminase
MSYSKKVISTNLAPAAVGTYSQGIEHNGIYYFSGQIGLNPKTGELAQGFSAQLKQVMHNIDGLLQACQLTRDHIIKSTIFLTDLSDFAEVNAAYTEFFKAPYPARSTVQVSALPKGALVEIEIMAGKN